MGKKRPPLPKSDRQDNSLPGRVLDINDLSQMEVEISKAEIPLVIDFWAPSCAPCREMAGIFETAAGVYSDKVQFARVNTQACPQITQSFNIRRIPTLAVFYQGEIFDVRVGLTSEARLNAMVRRVLNKHEGITLLDRIKRFWANISQ